MTIRSTALLCLFIAAAVVPASAHAQEEKNPTRQRPPSDLPGAGQMVQDAPKSESWTYMKPDLNLAKYRSIIIVPTAVYTGQDAQFKGVSAEEQQKYANFITQALNKELAKSFQIVTAPAPDALQLKITLLGAEETTGGVATVTRVLPIGFVTSAVRSMADKPGRLTGSLLMALEVTDSTTGELQAAAVRRKAPDALDISATVSTSDTVQSVAEDVARSLRERLDEAAGRKQK